MKEYTQHSIDIYLFMQTMIIAIGQKLQWPTKKHFSSLSFIYRDGDVQSIYKV